ncbi:hypothetical protein D1872_215220 [compost metagenome]
MATNLSFLEKCRILKWEKFEKNRVHCTLFNGDSSVARYLDVEFNSEAKKYVLGLGNDELFVSWNDSCFSISPFIHYKHEYDGHESIICSLKRLSEGNFVFEHSKTKQEEKFPELSERFSKDRELVKGIIS